MRKTTTLSAAVGIIAILGLSLPATATDMSEPLITDAAGDANFVNAQGNTAAVSANGPDTRPASLGGADLRSIAFSTRYATVKVRNPDGSVRMVDYRPLAMQIDITTTGPITPTFGPSLIFRVPTVISGCEAWFQGVIRGPLASNTNSGEVQRVELRKLNISGQPACPGGTGTMTSAEFGMEGGENTLKLVYPFSAFTGAMTGFITNGTQLSAPPNFINASRFPNVSTLHYTPTAPTLGSAGIIGVAYVDEAPKFTSFTVGSDVPADVICADTPEHPACA